MVCGERERQTCIFFWGRTLSLIAKRSRRDCGRKRKIVTNTHAKRRSSCVFCVFWEETQKTPLTFQRLKPAALAAAIDPNTAWNGFNPAPPVDDDAAAPPPPLLDTNRPPLLPPPLLDTTVTP